MSKEKGIWQIRDKVTMDERGRSKNSEKGNKWFNV